MSAETLPEVDDVIEEVLQPVGYSGRLEVLVVDKVGRVLKKDGAQWS